MKICITGISGYLASNICELLLSKGYIINGLTRNKNNCSRNMLLDPNIHIFEYDKIDECLISCKYIIHCASPCILNTDNLSQEEKDKIINDSISITNLILNKATYLNSKNITDIKKIIYTSSTCAIYDGTKNTYFSDYWPNEKNIDDIHSLSKIKSELEAWELYYKQKDKENKWELVITNPGRIIGPINKFSTRNPESWCSIYEILNMKDKIKDKNNIISLDNYYSSYCDVRNVAEIYLFLLNNNDYNEKRVIIAFDSILLSDYYNVIKNVTGYNFPEINFINQDTKFIFKMEEIIQKSISIINFETSMRDTLNSI